MKKKKIYVVGTEVSTSMSPPIFKYWFNKHNIDYAEYGYKEIKEEKPVVQNLSGPKRPTPEELNLESIRESVLQANEALLIKEDEPIDLVNQSAGEISTPTIGSDVEEEKDDIEMNHERMQKNLKQDLKRMFNPEFLNRLSETVVFRPLDVDHIVSILDVQ